MFVFHSMSINYSLRFKKLNIAHKVLVEKEGEIVFSQKYFILKGKGAHDQGETFYFTDIKELRTESDTFIFTTFHREQVILSAFGTSMENFFRDFYRLKNLFFAEHLFMKVGMLLQEFDCGIEYVNQFSKTVTKGRAKMQIYEGSIVFFPEIGDAFTVYLNFLKNHEFHEDEYVLEMEIDNGCKVLVSKLGSQFEDCQQAVESCMGKMYERVLNQLNQVLPGFSLQALLKLAYQIRSGRCVPVQSLKKIDATLPERVFDLALKDNPLLQEKIQFLRSLDKDEQFDVGFCFENVDGGRDVKVKAWFLCALPSKNTFVLGISTNEKDLQTYFFRIVMEQGTPKERMAGKILEINQCMVLFDYDLSPLFKDKNELKKSKYRVAVLKLAFLRLLRRSFLGKSQAAVLEAFKGDAERFFAQALALRKPVLRHRQMFGPVGRR